MSHHSSEPQLNNVRFTVREIFVLNSLEETIIWIFISFLNKGFGLVQLYLFYEYTSVSDPNHLDADPDPQLSLSGGSGSHFLF